MQIKKINFLVHFFYTEKSCHGPKALEILLDMLDFSCWRTNLDVWKLLKAVIEKLQLKYDMF